MKVGPKYKIARRLGARVFTKTQTTKFSISGSAQGKNKSGGPAFGGGGRRPRNLSEYGSQLIEKQKARYTYGLSEHQFARQVRLVQASRQAEPLTRLYRALESRLDNVVFRLGLAASRPFARQLVSHGHIMVNGRRVDIPSYTARVGDKISVRPESGAAGPFKELAERLKDYQTPEWLDFDLAVKAGTVKAAPLLGQGGAADIDFGAILEYYSRV